MIVPRLIGNEKLTDLDLKCLRKLYKRGDRRGYEAVLNLRDKLSFDPGLLQLAVALGEYLPAALPVPAPKAPDAEMNADLLSLLR